MCDSLLIQVRKKAAVRRRKFLYMTMVLLVAALAASWAAVRYLETISPQFSADSIAALKISVQLKKAAITGKTEASIRKSFNCAERIRFDPECSRDADKAVAQWRDDQAAYQRDITRLAHLGVTEDELHPSGFGENYGNDSPLNLERTRDQNKGLDVLRLIAGPIIFLLITWMNTFFIKQYMRYDTLLFVLGTIETDRALREHLTANGRILDLLH